MLHRRILLCIRCVLTVTLYILHADVHFSCRAALHYPPRNAAVVRGSVATLKCATGLDRAADWLQWLEYVSHPDGRVIVNGDVIVDRRRPARYEVRVRGDTSMLFIRDAYYGDSGRYACFNRRNNDTGYADLVILHSVPSCRSNGSVLGTLEDEYLLFICAVNYSGRWAPVMSWSSQGFRDDDIVRRGNMTVPGIAAYSLLFRAREKYNGRQFVLVVSFDQPREAVAQYESTFKAAFMYYHTTVPLNVLFGPRDIKIIPRKRVYIPGAIILIQARSNPPPQYSWVQLRTNRTIRSRILRIDASMMGRQSFVAIVSNRLLGTVVVHRKRINFTVKLYTSGRTAPLWGSVLGVTMLGTVCIAIAYLALIDSNNVLVRTRRAFVERFGIRQRRVPIENDTNGTRSIPATTSDLASRMVDFDTEVESQPFGVIARDSRVMGQSIPRELDEEEEEREVEILQLSATVRNTQQRD